MRIGFYPFYSQQDKYTGLFKQRTCGNAKQLAYIANVMRTEGHQCVAMVPQGACDTPLFRCETRDARLPLANPEQRLHWDVHMLKYMFHDCDVAVTNHEYMAIPLRALFPKLKIVQFCPVQPDSLLFTEAHAAANLIVVRTPYQKSALANANVAVWPMMYDEAEFLGVKRGEPLYQMCFLPRCSANNATNHTEFLAAIRDQQWRTIFTDVTGYLRMRCPELVYCNTRTYIQTLHESQLVVSLYDSWSGQMGLCEAIRAGCTPVVMRTDANVKFFGHAYPYFVDRDLHVLRHVLSLALALPRPQLPDVSQVSFQACTQTIVESLCRL